MGDNVGGLVPRFRVQSPSAPPTSLLLTAFNCPFLSSPSPDPRAWQGASGLLLPQKGPAFSPLSIFSTIPDPVYNYFITVFVQGLCAP